MSRATHAGHLPTSGHPTAIRSNKKRACTTAATVRTEGVETLMDALAGGTDERRLLATVYAHSSDPHVRAATRGLVLLMLSREDDMRRALALCDHAHVSLQHAEKHDDYGAVPGDSEATDGRSLAVVIGRALDVLATPLRAPEHAPARADLAALFATWDERIIEPWIACRLRVRHKAALAAEYATWKAASA